MIFLLGVIVIIICAKVAGRAANTLGQPPVMGEIFSGIVLGLILHSTIAVPIASQVFSPSFMGPLAFLAKIGIVAYMFLVGADMDFRDLGSRIKRTIPIAASSFILPFVAGVLLAWRIYDQAAPAGIHKWGFSLFVGISLSVTAFPVLSRILTDQKLQRTDLGITALTCAACDDITVWSCLALITALFQNDLSHGIYVFGYMMLYIVLMLAVVPRLIAPLVRSSGIAIPTVILGLIASAYCAEKIGLHAVFGAFLFGVVLQVQTRSRKELEVPLSWIAQFCLPLFFALAGLKLQFNSISTTHEWLICGVVIVTAIGGKFIGATTAARMVGMRWLDATVLGVLMNTRGLVELIVLNLGLELGYLSPKLYTMLTLMAIVTTFMTAPLLRLLTRRNFVWTSTPVSIFGRP